MCDLENPVTIIMERLNIYCHGISFKILSIAIHNKKKLFLGCLRCVHVHVLCKFVCVYVKAYIEACGLVIGKANVRMRPSKTAS